MKGKSGSCIACGETIGYVNPLVTLCKPVTEWVNIVDKKITRMARMLVGNVPLGKEIALFEFLWSIEDRVLIEKNDHIGCSTTTKFSIELLNKNCKPV